MSEASGLPKPRGRLRTALALGTLPAFAGGLLGFASALAMLMLHERVGPAVLTGVFQGVVFGVVFGIIMAAGLCGETLNVVIGNPSAFAERVNRAAAEIGCRPRSSADSLLAFRPGWKAGLLAGTLTIQVRDRDAVIVGPRIYVRSLALRLEIAAKGGKA